MLDWLNNILGKEEKREELQEVRKRKADIQEPLLKFLDMGKIKEILSYEGDLKFETQIIESKQFGSKKLVNETKYYDKTLTLSYYINVNFSPEEVMDVYKTQGEANLFEKHNLRIIVFNDSFNSVEVYLGSNMVKFTIDDENVGKMEKISEHEINRFIDLGKYVLDIIVKNQHNL